MTNHAATHSVHLGTGFSGRLLAQAMQLQRAERDYMNEADKLAICARVKKAREEAGLTETEIAEMLDPPVVDRTIRNYESVRPPFKYLRQWAEITRTEYDWLLRGEAQPREVPADETDIQELRRRLDEVADLVARGFEALGISQDQLRPGGGARRPRGTRKLSQHR